MDTDAAGLKDRVFSAFRINLTEVLPIGGGADASASTYQVTAVKGERYFLKVRSERSPALALSIFLHRSGIQEVLAPLSSQGDSLLLYPWIDGASGFQRIPSLDQWHKIGRILRRVHDIDLPGDIHSVLPEESYVVPGVDDFRRLMERLPALPARNDIELRVAELVHAHQTEIEQTIRETEDLGKACRSQSLSLVPCHTDIHMGNVLIEESGAVHLIDWDAPRLAPRECDLMFFVDGGILGRHGKAEEEAFLQGYGPYEIDGAVIDYFRHERRLGDIVSFAHEAVEMEGRTPEQKWEALQWFERQFNR